MSSNLLLSPSERLQQQQRQQEIGLVTNITEFLEKHIGVKATAVLIIVILIICIILYNQKN